MFKCSVMPFAPKPQRKVFTLVNSPKTKNTNQKISVFALQNINEDDSLVNYSEFKSDLNDEYAYNEITSILQGKSLVFQLEDNQVEVIPRANNTFMKNYDFFEKNSSITLV